LVFRERDGGRTGVALWTLRRNELLAEQK